MKKFLKNNKFKIIIVLFFTYIILILVDIYFYREFVNNSFNEYIKAQGLSEEFSDNPGEITNDNFFLTGKLKREVIYTENFRTHYVYETLGRKFPAIPILNLIDYKLNIEKDPNLYKGVNFYNVNYQGKIIFGEFGSKEKKIHEGQLDKNGNLLLEIGWKKDYEYDENGPEVKNFLESQNQLFKELYEEGSEKELLQFDSFRELYKYFIKEDIFGGFLPYNHYLEYIVDSIKLEQEWIEEFEEQENMATDIIEN